MSLILDGTIGVQGNSGAFIADTAKASTSGTTVDFTGIPSWVKRITVMLNTVSANGTGIIMLQLGDAGGIETTGYTGSVVRMVAGGNGTGSLSAGFLVSDGSAASQNFSGIFIASYIGSNTWVVTGSFGGADAARCSTVSGVKTLSDVLTQVRVTTSNGTDTFDAGTINILYE
jgi:hypothetical protein